MSEDSVVGVLTVAGKEIDYETLANDLAVDGLIAVVARDQFHPFHDDYNEYLDAIVDILKRPNAPSVEVALNEKISTVSGHNFFRVQNAICDLIPRLEIGHRPMMRLVSGLVEAGGADLAAGLPNAAFRKWCAVDPKRTAAICADARQGDLLALRHLMFALEAHNAVGEAVEFAGSNVREAQLAAATALGRMDIGGSAEPAMSALLTLAGFDDEIVSLTALKAAFCVTESTKIGAALELETALALRLGLVSPHTIHFAADLLWQHAKVLTPQALDSCLDAVEAVDPKNNGTIGSLDYALKCLVEIGRVDRATLLVGRICDRTNGEVSLSSFDSLMHQLKSGDPDILGRAVVFWLLNGGPAVRKSLATELTDVGRDEPTYSVPADCIPTAPETQLFLCRKAVGWFFNDPLSVAPVLLGVLRYGSSEVAPKVRELVFDPLVLSYGGKLRVYLEAQSRTDMVLGAQLAAVIEQKEALHRDADGCEAIVELRPSETRREAERVLWQQQMSEGMENANKRSVLHDLFTKQYILYGRSSVHTVHHGDGNTEIVESEMKSFSVSAEMPLLEIVDPARLHFSLFQMRFEAHPQT